MHWVHPLIIDKPPELLPSLRSIGAREMKQIRVPGRLVVYHGSESFKSEMGPCSMLRTKALGSESDAPDFDTF